MIPFLLIFLSILFPTISILLNNCNGNISFYTYSGANLYFNPSKSELIYSSEKDTNLIIFKINGLHNYTNCQYELGTDYVLAIVSSNKLYAIFMSSMLNSTSDLFIGIEGNGSLSTTSPCHNHQIINGNLIVSLKVNLEYRCDEIIFNQNYTKLLFNSQNVGQLDNVYKENNDILVISLTTGSIFIVIYLVIYILLCIRSRDRLPERKRLIINLQRTV